MRTAFAILLGTSLALGASVGGRIQRTAVLTLEKNFDTQVERMSIDDPFFLLGSTRGLYLEGYGVVFTSELNLVSSGVVSPFRPQFTKEEIARLKQKKQLRIGVLKKNMRDMLIRSAGMLDALPGNEQIVLGVNLFYFSWEDSAGLPRQIVMQAPRKALQAAANGDLASLDAVLQVREF